MDSRRCRRSRLAPWPSGFSASKSSAKVYDTIAVMPFVISGGGTSQEDISDGITDEVIKRLCQVAALRVKATAAVLPYKKSSKSIKEMGRELGVKALVMSRISLPAGRFKISVDLVDAETANVLWTDVYEEDRSEIIVLQSRMALDLVRNVRIRISGDERARLAKFQKIWPDAHVKYFRVYRLVVTTGQGYSKPVLEESISLLKEAIALEPDYAPFYTLLLIYMMPVSSITSFRSRKSRVPSRRRSPRSSASIPTRPTPTRPVRSGIGSSIAGWIV